MIINFDDKVHDLYGKPLCELQRDRGEPVVDDKGQPVWHDVRLHELCVASLLAGPRQGTIPHDEMWRRFQLAERLSAGGEIEIGTTDANLLIECFKASHGILVYGIMYRLFEGITQH